MLQLFCKLFLQLFINQHHFLCLNIKLNNHKLNQLLQTIQYKKRGVEITDRIQTLRSQIKTLSSQPKNPSVEKAIQKLTNQIQKLTNQESVKNNTSDETENSNPSQTFRQKLEELKKSALKIAQEITDGLKIENNQITPLGEIINPSQLTKLAEKFPRKSKF